MWKREREGGKEEERKRNKRGLERNVDIPSAAAIGDADAADASLLVRWLTGPSRLAPRQSSRPCYLHTLTSFTDFHGQTEASRGHGNFIPMSTATGLFYDQLYRSTSSGAILTWKRRENEVSRHGVFAWRIARSSSKGSENDSRFQLRLVKKLYWVLIVSSAHCKS